MALSEILPRSGKRTDLNAVRYAFYDRKSQPTGHRLYTLTLTIGLNIAKTLGITPGQKIRFFCDDQDSRHWVIKKSDNGTGYTLNQHCHVKTNLKCHIKWDIFEPLEPERHLTKALYEIKDGNLIIYARGQ